MSSGMVDYMIRSLKNNVRKRKTLYDKQDVFTAKPPEVPKNIPQRKTTERELRQIRQAIEGKRQKELVILSVAFFVLVTIGLLVAQYYLGRSWERFFY
ncbi:MAG: hypothetical protein R2798_13450 [Chitinophagales bacterium]|nr:hypothetical protein [Bacteroidota bacterium]MCB9044241.1 hypothetical protein [Chitinophagales bacterium]